MKNEIRLKSPRISNGKLSSSADTDAVILGKRDINSSCVYKNVYTDFAKMVYETFNKKSRNENDRLVFIASEKCVSSEFDEITQSQKVIIEDRQGRRISLKARYRNESSDIVERLDKTGKIMMNNPGINYVIFGSAYIENGNCYIYPIGIYDDIYVSKMTPKSHYISELSGAYLYFHDLFDEVQSMLCDIIQCGINSFDLYTQIKLLKDLYFGCPDAKEWDRNEADYVHALDEMKAKQRWLRNVNRVKKEAWLK